MLKTYKKTSEIREQKRKRVETETKQVKTEKKTSENREEN